MFDVLMETSPINSIAIQPERKEDKKRYLLSDIGLLSSKANGGRDMSRGGSCRSRVYCHKKNHTHHVGQGLKLKTL